MLYTLHDGTTISDLLHQHTLVLHNLKTTSVRLANMSDQANLHRIDRSFEVHEWVWLRHQPYRQHSVHRRPCTKLASHYSSPYQIICRISMVEYELCLPLTSHVHLVFHVSMLIPFRGNLPYETIISSSTSKNLPLNSRVSNSLDVQANFPPTTLTPPPTPSNENVPPQPHPVVPHFTSSLNPLEPLHSTTL